MNILRFELKRSFGSPWFRMVILIGIVYSILHFVFRIYPYLPTNSAMPLSAFNAWFPMRPNEYFSVSLYLLMPILAAMPYADSYYTDLNDHYMRLVTTRVSKGRYLLAKTAAVFLTGSLSFTFILVLNFIIVSSFLPLVFPQFTDGTYTVGANSMWGELFYESPFRYIVLYTILNFMFAGLFAVFSLAVSAWATHRFMALLAPFVLNLFILFLCDWTEKLYAAPFYFLPPGQAAMFVNIKVIAAVFAGVAVVSGMMLYAGAYRREAT